jgi:uncharacterized protein (TIGR04255 family)
MPLEHLPNAPLVEASFEMRFPGEPIVLTRIHDYFQDIRKEYPALYVPNAELGVAPALQPWEFKDVDAKRCVAVSVNSFSYRVGNYVDYADFRANAVPLASQFAEQFKIKQVTRLGARYVNSIAVLRLPEQPLNLAQYMQIGLQLPSIVDTNRLEDIHLQFATRTEQLQVGVTLHHQQGRKGTPENLILILDCALVGGINISNLEASLDSVHAQIEDLFQALAAEPYMRYMKEETAQ